MESNFSLIVKTLKPYLFQVQHQEIIVQLPCPPPNGTTALRNFGYLKSDKLVYDYDNVVVAMVIFYAIFIIATCFLFIINYKKSRYKQKGKTDANRP